MLEHARMARGVASNPIEAAKNEMETYDLRLHEAVAELFFTRDQVSCPSDDVLN